MYMALKITNGIKKNGITRNATHNISKHLSLNVAGAGASGGGNPIFSRRLASASDNMAAAAHDIAYRSIIVKIFMDYRIILTSFISPTTSPISCEYRQRSPG